MNPAPINSALEKVEEIDLSTMILSNGGSQKGEVFGELGIA